MKRRNKIKQWIYKKLMPEDDYRRFLMSRVYEPLKVNVETKNIRTVMSQVVLNQQSYDFIHSGTGQEQYDMVYGLTRQLSDELKNYVEYTESYDEEFKEWTCRVSLKVVTK